jgi:hypothetical protein
VVTTSQRQKKLVISVEQAADELLAYHSSTTTPSVAALQQVAMSVIVEGDYDSKIERQTQQIDKQMQVGCTTTTNKPTTSATLGLLDDVVLNARTLVDRTSSNTTSTAVVATRRSKGREACDSIDLHGTCSVAKGGSALLGAVPSTQTGTCAIDCKQQVDRSLHTEYVRALVF